MTHKRVNILHSFKGIDIDGYCFISYINRIYVSTQISISQTSQYLCQPSGSGCQLAQGDRSRSIIAFLRLGLIFLILGLSISIIACLYGVSQKASIADRISRYTSGVIAQLPTDMTGSMTISGGTMRLHLNNDKAFVINLTKDMDEKIDDGHLNNTGLTILVDTSLSTMPASNEYKAIITQNAILINNGDQNRFYSFDELNKGGDEKNETIEITQKMIQSSPGQIAPFIEEYMGTVMRGLFAIMAFIIIIFGAIMLPFLAIGYFILCFIIRCLVSIITTITKWDIPHNKRDLICLLGFGPFIIHLFVMTSRIYIVAMTLYISVLIYQHHQFHQKK